MSVFDDELKRAIEYILQNGFDNVQFISYTLNRLRKAAEASYPSDAQLQTQMERALENNFKRAVSNKRLNAFNPGVSRFTIDRIMPKLRIELDRRIRTNANLIVLNRQQAIDKTLQRFAGWASSVPVGGSRATNKSDVKSDITKISRQLRYETRRREIDQGHKLIAAIDAVIAEQTGAIAAIWHSHWRQAGYDYREDHKERDQNVYAIRNNWAIDKGLMKKGAAGYLDEITQPGQEINCKCNAIYLLNLRDLPDSMLTEKGREVLKETRIK